MTQNDGGKEKSKIVLKQLSKEYNDEQNILSITFI